MAVLEKIRSKGVFLLIAIGGALLAFVIGDFLHSGSSYFNRSREIVGKVDGEEINIKEFNAAVEEMQQVYKIEMGRSDFNEQMLSEIRNQVWEMMVNEKLLNKEADKLGLSVGIDELEDRCMGNNIHPLIQQRRGFAGKDGRFSKELLIKFLKSLESTPSNDEMAQQISMLKSYWKFWEKTVKNSLLQEKYMALLSKSTGANKIDARMSFTGHQSTVDVAFVSQPYFSIPDNQIKIEDNELTERYNKEKAMFAQEPSVSVDIVTFPIKPLAEDYAEAKTWLEKVSQEFKTTDDVASVVNSNSDIIYDGRKYSTKTVPANLKDFAFGGKTGDIYGPVFVNDIYTMARIMESGIMQSDSVKLRHIFLTTADAAKVDSLMAVLKSGGNFAELAAKFSAVKETAQNGGEIGWLQEGTPGLDKSLASAFEKSTGEIFTVKSVQGVQIMQVMEKTSAKPKVKLAILERKVTASSKSNSKIYNQAKEFAAENTEANFASKAKSKGYSIRPIENVVKSYGAIPGIDQSRQVIRWAFKGKKGEVSDVFECSGQYVVALNKEVNETGYRSLENVKPQLKAELIKDKKAELISKNIASILSKSQSLEALAVSLHTDVKTATGINFGSYQLGIAGSEMTVIGKASTLDINKISSPIKGNSGVFVIKTTNKIATNQPYNEKAEVGQLNARLGYMLPYSVIQNMKLKGKIEDNRLNFF